MGDIWLDLAIIVASAAIFLRVGIALGWRARLSAVAWLDRLVESQRAVILAQRDEIARLRARASLPVASRVPESSIN